MPDFPVTSGLRALFDASALGLANNATVTGETDQSGFSNNTTVPSGFSGPVFKTNVSGTFPGIQFNASATDQCLSGSFNAGTWASGNAGWTHLLMICNAVASADTYGRIFSAAQSGLTDYFHAGGCAIYQEWNRDALVMNSDNSPPTGTAFSILPMINIPTVIGFAMSATKRTIFAGGMPIFEHTSAITVGTPLKFAFAQNIVSGNVASGVHTKYTKLMSAHFNRHITTAEYAAASRYMYARVGAFGLTTRGGGGLSGGLQ